MHLSQTVTSPNEPFIINERQTNDSNDQESVYRRYISRLRDDTRQTNRAKVSEATLLELEFLNYVIPMFIIFYLIIKVKQMKFEMG